MTPNLNDADLRTGLNDLEAIAGFPVYAFGLVPCPSTDGTEPPPFDEVRLALDYLVEAVDAGEAVLSKEVEPFHTSYGWKHRAEVGLMARPRSSRCYISNGSFIAAAVLLGIPVRAISDDSPNVYLALSFVPGPDFLTLHS